jgi:hypothetical protein
MREESCSKPASRLFEKMTPESNVTDAMAVKMTSPKLRTG